MQYGVKMVTLKTPSYVFTPLGILKEGVCVCVCVCLGCGDKVPQTGRLTQQKLTVSHLGELQVRRQGVGSVGSFESCE